VTGPSGTHDPTADGTRTPDPVDYSDADVTLDAGEDRWAWRARLRRNPVTHAIWRTAVGVVGALVTGAGLVMVPAPGPGWLIVFFGLLILASEFEFAQRWLDFAKHHVSRWNDWIMGRALWVRGLVALGTLAVVGVVVWGYLAVAGVPQFAPEWAEQLLARLPGVD
jgi:uncharacterized protein (TIGR02611 family)